MPVYDCRLNHPVGPRLGPAPYPLPGALPFPRFAGRAGKLVDANGVHIPFAIRCCTETGFVERYERVDGRFVLDPQTFRLVVSRGVHPAPLRYVPMEVGNDDVESDRVGPVRSRGA